MANIWEKAISILAGNLNLGHSYLITTVCSCHFVNLFSFNKPHVCLRLSYITWFMSQQPTTDTDVEHHCNVCVAITLQCQCVFTLFLLYTDGVYIAAFTLNCPYSSLLLGLCILEMFSDTRTIFWSSLTSWIQSKAAIKLSDISRLLFFLQKIKLTQIMWQKKIRLRSYISYEY